MKLHLGCGPIHLPGFVNIDISEHWQPDVLMDYTRLDERYEANSAEYIACVHSLEHLEWDAGVVKALAQMFRVLKPGGVARILVPDFKMVAAKYLAGNDLRSLFGGEHFYQRDYPATRFLYFCREWQHTVIFDEELLAGLMREAGFVVRKMPFGVSDIEALRGIDRFPEESLCLEGMKP